MCTLYNIIIVALINARTGDPLQADGRGGGGGGGGHAPRGHSPETGAGT